MKDEIYDVFLVDNTNLICYLEEKEVVSEESVERIQILLDSKKALNYAKTLEGFGYAIKLVRKILSTPNEYEVLNR